VFESGVLKICVGVLVSGNHSIFVGN
jgi:hypothetical protein